jgi:hypothetical protein
LVWLLHTWPQRDFTVFQLSFVQIQRDSPEYVLYGNSLSGIQIELPSTWFYKVNYTLVSILYPTENKPSNNGVYTTLTTSVFENENASTNLNQAQIAQLSIQTVNGSLSNFRVDKYNITMISGISASEILYLERHLEEMMQRVYWYW